MKWEDYLNSHSLLEQIQVRLYAIRNNPAGKVTQKELAKMLKTGQPAISRIENGSRLPSLSMLEKIAKALGYKVIINFKKL